MGYATKAEILAAKDSDVADVDVRGWGKIRLRSLSVQERLDLTGKYGDDVTAEQAVEFYCELLALSLVDDAGERMFTANGDVASLKTRDFKTIEFVAQEILKHNGMQAGEETAGN